ncbi:MAG: FAD binding domain-containing protein [Acidimicrobiia bacterium]
MKPPPFRYACPTSMEEALALRAEHGDEARPLAGGQSLVPMLNMRLARPAVLVDLNQLPGIDAISAANGHLAVGALARQRALERSPAAGRIGALADSLPLVGHTTTRNRGTVGGSIAHADPAAELPLALVALGGSVVAAGPHGARTIAAEEFFAGFLTTNLAADELVVEVRFPMPAAGEGSAVEEMALRHGDFALAMAAVWLRLEDGRVAAARVAVGAVSDRPVLVHEAAGALLGHEPSEEAARAAGAAAAGALDPAGSLHAPADYQRHLVEVLVARAVERAAARAAQAGAMLALPGPQSHPPSGPTSGEAGCAVNGRTVAASVDNRRLLSDFLRHDAGLRGTHVGCEHGVCGACTVRLDGAAVRSCLMLAVQAGGTEIATVEGLADGDRLHPLQEAFRRHFALQCGFCTPGILMAAAELCDEVAAGAPVPTETDIRRLLSGHLCRCTGYEPIVAAITEVLAATEKGS